MRPAKYGWRPLSVWPWSAKCYASVCIGLFPVVALATTVSRYPPSRPPVVGVGVWGMVICLSELPACVKSNRSDRCGINCCIPYAHLLQGLKGAKILLNTALLATMALLGANAPQQAGSHYAPQHLVEIVASHTLISSKA